MLPKEHGAYGQLLIPLAAVLAGGRPSQGYAAALALTAAAVCIFLAHEPLLVLLGERGVRVAREQRPRAQWWLSGLAVTAIVLGAIGAALADRAVQQALIAPCAAALVLGALVASRAGHTTAGELASAVAFASIALPVGLAAHLSFAQALSCALAFATAFTVATLSVRAVIVWKRHPLGRLTRLGAAAFGCAALAALVSLARAGVLVAAAPWAALPVCTVAIGIAAIAPAPRHLRTVGWTLVAATVAAAILLVVSFR